MTDIVKMGFGPNDRTPEQVDDLYNAGRLSIRPLDHRLDLLAGTAGGHYILTAIYSNTAAKPAAGSDVLSLRWSDTKLLFVLNKLTLSLTVTTAYTASLAQDATLYKASGFSVAASAGTNISAVIGQRLRNNNMNPTSLIAGGNGQLWVSSGDALTVGTRTLDTYPMGYISWINAITTPTIVGPLVLFDATLPGKHPIILGPSEGIVVQTPIGNAQVAGVSKWAFTLEYSELAQY